MSVPLTGVGAAGADEASLTPANFAYFFSKGVDKPEESPAAPPNVTALVADGVSAGNLAVAANAGTEDKVSFLYFDLFNVPVDATVSRAVVSMTPLPTSPEDVSFNAAPESIVACAAGPEGFKEDDGAGIVNAPARLCAAFKAVGKAGQGGAYDWDITALAQQWVSGINDGVGFTRADESPGSNFQVVFGKAVTAKLALSYTLPEVFVEPPPVTPVTPQLPGVPAVGGFVPPPTDGFGQIPEVVVPNPQANPAPAPVTSAPVTATRPIALSTSLRPDTQLWLAGLGIALVLLAVSLIMGDPSAPVAARSRSRLAQALEAQRRTASPALRARPL
ncbi:MAG: hypothetical protein M3P04_14665 [Actinomycetota bacterium]|nr:hypothetical protein [Actinomycetota bacterium]